MYVNMLIPILAGAYVTFYPPSRVGGTVPAKAST